MPIRYITVPPPVTLIDPVTNEPLKNAAGELEKPISFDTIIIRLMAHTLWSETYANTKAQHEVMQALKAQSGGVISLGDEDWQKLKQAAESPRFLAFNPVIIYQLLPLLTAIMDAPTTDPRQAAATPLKTVEAATQG